MASYELRPTRFGEYDINAIALDKNGCECDGKCDVGKVRSDATIHSVVFSEEEESGDSEEDESNLNGEHKHGLR